MTFWPVVHKSHYGGIKLVDKFTQFSIPERAKCGEGGTAPDLFHTPSLSAELVVCARTVYLEWAEGCLKQGKISALVNQQ